MKALDALKVWLSKVLSETGEVSATRLHLFLSLILGFIIALIGLYKNSDLASLAILVGTFVGPSAALKGFQKTIEKE